ncbi:ferritin family protein [Alkaliphilus pronyensis]|uniref:Ferritin family protein n=1 Tax=Alkaliphilus pronyensis TaxID=1482732 RepID=A0A6I0F042_9FIRM|nr:ferritin family protein [Alkaliphilus pronyensis]KAB3533582.1 ferritin family protein [Alkaliphilus pronyensis]
MKDKELRIIQQAMLIEVEGFEFYQMAAKQCGNKESEKAFMELANEELMHGEYLKGLFEKIQNGDDDKIKLAFLPKPPESKVFDWKNVNMKSTSLAVSVFGIAVDMEKASIEFYKNARNNTSSEEAQKLYDMLIEWEQVHLEQFTKRYNEFKEDWWTHQGFAPF